jgi:hypothetical protein
VATGTCTFAGGAVGSVVAVLAGTFARGRWPEGLADDLSRSLAAAGPAQFALATTRARTTRPAFPRPRIIAEDT